MKFVIYRGRKKITVDNAWMSDMETLAKLMTESQLEELAVADLQNMRITSLKGMLVEDIKIDNIDNGETPIETHDGIKWEQETVN